MRYVVHGSFENPNKAKSYARFSSAFFLTREEAEAQLWKSTRTYTYQWVEEVKK